MSLNKPSVIDMRVAWNRYCSLDMSEEESNEKFNAWIKEFKDVTLNKLVEDLVEESIRIHTEENFHKKQKLGFDNCIDFINNYRFSI